MTRKQKEQLVLLIASGKNTYADISQIISEDEIEYAVSAPFENLLKELHPRKRSKTDVYTYQASDTFALTETAMDILDDALQKQHQENLAQKNLFLVCCTLFVSILALLVALFK